MVHRSNDVAGKDAKIIPSKEECALSMEQQSSDVAKKDVTALQRKEEFVLGTGQRLRSNYAASKDAITKSTQKERAKNIGRRSNLGRIYDWGW